MSALWSFFSGLFLANALPHLIHGISGEEFHTPNLHRLIPRVPSPSMNAAWGLLNLGLVLGCRHLAGTTNGPAAAGGFAFAALGLSLYFRRRTLRATRPQ